MTLYLVRHGRPVVDPGTPAPDWELDPRHEAAVLALAAQAPWPDDAVWFTSPEPKARRTAALLTGRDVEVVASLHEHDRGPNPWIDDFATAMAEAFARPGDAVREAWEPLDATLHRVAAAVDPILAAHPDQDVVLVGHGTAWTVLAAALTGTAPDVERWGRLAMPDVITVEVVRSGTDRPRPAGR